ncbi:MAG: phage holin family protein, partial [Anaerolineales bacterium]|nr:phage holin family protein [Anaerolineales bacterium]
MPRFLIRLIVNAIALWVAIKIVPGIVYDGTNLSLLIIALIFGVVNALVRPLLVILTCPLIVLTLGLFLLVVNGLMLSLTAWISGIFNLGLYIDGFWATLLGAVVVSIVSG